MIKKITPNPLIFSPGKVLFSKADSAQGSRVVLEREGLGGFPGRRRARRFIKKNQIGLLKK